MYQARRDSARPIGLLILLILTASVTASGQSETSVIAYSGQDAPGTSSQFASFSRAFVNDVGTIWFRAETADGLNAWWTVNGNDVRLLTRSDGTPLPGGSSLQIDDDGRAVALEYSEGILMGPPEALQLVTEMNRDFLVQHSTFREPRPGLVEPDGPLASSGGYVAFRSMISLRFDADGYFDRRRGLFVSGGGTTLAVMERFRMPWIAENAGGYIQNRGEPYPMINHSGEMALVIRYHTDDLSGDPDGTWYESVYRLQSSGDFQAVREEPASNAEFRRPTINSGGQVAYIERELSNGVPLQPAVERVWHESRLVASSGDVADGTGGLTFRGFDDVYLLDDGRVVVRGGTTDFMAGYWIETEGALKKMVRAGEPAPGIPVNFSNADLSGFLNNDGRVAINRTSGGGGVWIADADSVFLAARAGEYVELEPGEERRITQLRLLASAAPMSTSTIGARNAFNTRGDLVIRVQFFENLSQQALIRVGRPPLVVNSTGDAPNADPGDGFCDTGNTVTRGGAIEPECTLRAAIQESNSGQGGEKITFDIPESAPHVIRPASHLPAIMTTVTIGGWSIDTAPHVVLDGSDVGGDGLTIGPTATDTRIDQLSIINFEGHGILVRAHRAHITGCYIGVDPWGDPHGNAGSGIRLEGVSGGTIGGNLPEHRNIISGNARHGVAMVNSTDARIEGNWIGFFRPGGSAVPNAMSGVDLSGGQRINIGSFAAGPGLAPGNIISGNQGNGISVDGTRHAFIRGNLVGTEVSGGNRQHGVFITGSENTIGDDSDPGGRNVISNNGGFGVRIEGPENGGNRVLGNYIGTDGLGTTALPNEGPGIYVVNSPGNEIGSALTYGRNVVSGNRGPGIEVAGESASGNVILGNHIGTSGSGTGAIPNEGSGIYLLNASETEIGSGEAGGRNLISGNTGPGIEIVGHPATDNRIAGNWIGVDMLGSGPLGNSIGILLEGARRTTVGGAAEGEGNVISGNEAFGLRQSGGSGLTLKGNFIGTNANGTASLGNGIAGVLLYNSIENRIGGTAAGARNVISGNGGDGPYHTSEVHLDRSSGNVVQGNFIGADVTGNSVLGRSHSALRVTNGGHNVIGGAEAGAGNIIGGSRTLGTHVGVWCAGYGGEHGGNRIEGNHIGVDESGTSRLSEEHVSNGIRVRGACDQLVIGGLSPGSGNVIAGSTAGITISAQQSPPDFVRIQGNRIGTDRSGTVDLGFPGRGIEIRHDGIHTRAQRYLIGGHSEHARNHIANAVHGILLGAPNEILANAQVMVTGNEIRNCLATGLTADGSWLQSNLWIAGNELIGNETGLRINGRIDAHIEGNLIRDGFGLSSGIHLVGSSPVIRGNTITGDAGDAIVLKETSRPRIEKNNLFGNQGLAVHNFDGSVTVDARGNWWGDASGPGGEGDGSGDGVSAGVDFSGWRGESVSLSVAATADTAHVRPGGTDSVLVVVRDLTGTASSVELAAGDELGWLEGDGNLVLSVDDAGNAGWPAKFVVPSGTASGSTSMMTVVAAHPGNTASADTTTFIISAYESELTGIFVAPDSARVVPGDTLHFTARGQDQLGHSFEVAPTWSASGGTIDETGLYIAGDEPGYFTVNATFSGLDAAVVVEVMSGVDREEDAPDLPAAFRLHANYPNPFNPATTIVFEVAEPAHVRLAVYDLLGREVIVLVDEQRAPGRYDAVFNASGLASGLYLYRIEMAGFTRLRKMMLVK